MWSLPDVLSLEEWLGYVMGELWKDRDGNTTMKIHHIMCSYYSYNHKKQCLNIVQEHEPKKLSPLSLMLMPRILSAWLGIVLIVMQLGSLSNQCFITQTLYWMVWILQTSLNKCCNVSMLEHGNIAATPQKSFSVLGPSPEHSRVLWRLST